MENPIAFVPKALKVTVATLGATFVAAWLWRRLDELSEGKRFRE